MGSSGGTNTTIQQNTYDPEASRRLAEVSERQVALQEEMMDYYNEVFKPYEIEVVDTARANLAAEGALEAEQIAAQRTLLADKTELEQSAVREQIRDIEANRALRDAAREEQMREIERTSLVADTFYDKALRGVNIQERLDTATADVVQAMSQQQAQTVRQAARYGVGPRAVDFTSSGLEAAKAVAGQRTATRRSAEAENFSMLQSAMAARGQGVASVSNVAGTGSIPYTASTGTGNNLSVTNPVSAAQGFGSMGVSGLSALATRTTGTTATSPASSVSPFAGAIAGATIGGSVAGGQGALIGGGLGAVGSLFA